MFSFSHLSASHNSNNGNPKKHWRAPASVFWAGAAARHLGKFEQANHGTLFLDEIGDMPLFMQAKLLRVLEERQVERVGGDRTIPVDVRVIVATHRNLHELVKKGVF